MKDSAAWSYGVVVVVVIIIIINTKTTTVGEHKEAR
jgi:hypothetical protein